MEASDNLVNNRVLVTGGGGYIGSRLLEKLLEKHYAVCVLSRRLPIGFKGRVAHIPWSLGDELQPGAIKDGDLIIHLAHVWNTTGDPKKDPNYAGILRLLEEARNAGAGKFVLASSASARPDALNRYGRLKSALEDLLQGPNEAAARIGLVYGGAYRGQWGTLTRLALLSVLPMLNPWTPVQPIHLDDLCDGLIAMLTAKKLDRRVYGLADSCSVTFGEFLSALARIKHGQRTILLPVPAGLVLMGIRVMEFVPGIRTVDRERVLGLIGIRQIESSPSLSELNLQLRSLEDGLSRSVWEQRKALISEAYALLGAVLGDKPSVSAIRRYVHVVMASEDMTALPLSRLQRRSRIITAMAEPFSKRPGIFHKRFDIAARIAEASPEGAKKFYRHDGFAGILLRCIRLFAREAVIAVGRAAFKAAVK